MKNLFIVLKSVQGTETRSLKVYEIENNTPIILLDEFITKGENIIDFTSKSLESFIIKELVLENEVKFNTL